MKKHLLAPFLLAMALFCLPALAEPGENIASTLQYTAPESKNISKLYDGDHMDNFRTGQKYKKYLEIRSETPIHTLYLRWMDLPSSWAIQVKEDGKWVNHLELPGRTFRSEVVRLPGLTHFRICSLDINIIWLTLFELEAYTEGSLPAHVQQWEANKEKKDIMLLVAHPDDELLFFGGLIPTYARSKDMQLQVTYMTYGVRNRIFELLNGLWHCGLRNYPSIGKFCDAYSISMNKVLQMWNKEKALRYVVDEIRKHRPDVVVTHDIGGEYGHGAHKACAALADEAFYLAADADYVTEYAPWQVKKLYVHLGDSDVIHMDWEGKSDVFNGKSALDIAAEAFAFHQSQQSGKASYNGEEFLFRVVSGGMFDNAKFRLLHSTVGEDVIKNDFFENLK